MHPEDRAAQLANLQQALAGDVSEYNTEFRVIWPDQSVRHIKANGMVQRDAAGRPLRMLGTNWDITARKQTEATLQQNQRLLAQTEKLGQVGGWEIELATQKVVWTAMVYQIHELTPDYQPVVTEASRFFAPASWPVVAQAVQRLIEQGEPFDLELEIITARGNRRWVHNVGELDRERGKICGFMQDITQRRQAEAALRRSQFALDHISDSVFWITEDARFSYVNEAACRSLGYTEAELLAMSVGGVDPTFQAAHWAKHWAELRQFGSLTLETQQRAKDGRLFHAEVLANYVEFGGQVYNCAFARDISDRKRTAEVTSFLASTGVGQPEAPFFPALVRYLAESLRMDIVCIDHLEADGLTVRTLAVWSDGKLDSNMTYALQDTPCGDVWAGRSLASLSASSISSTRSAAPENWGGKLCGRDAFQPYRPADWPYRGHRSPAADEPGADGSRAQAGGLAGGCRTGASGGRSRAAGQRGAVPARLEGDFRCRLFLLHQRGRRARD